MPWRAVAQGTWPTMARVGETDCAIDQVNGPAQLFPSWAVPGLGGPPRFSCLGQPKHLTKTPTEKKTPLKKENGKLEGILLIYDSYYEWGKLAA